MDLASVVAALASVGVRVSGSTPNSSVQGDSSRACPTGLAGPEPSGTINDPRQHFQEATWEPFSAFVLPEGRLNSVLVDYLSQNKLGELLRLAETLASKTKARD